LVNESLISKTDIRISSYNKKSKQRDTEKYSKEGICPKGKFNDTELKLNSSYNMEVQEMKWY